MKYGGIRDEPAMRENLRMNCIPESLLDGGIKDFNEFLEERHRLMALKTKTWFDALQNTEAWMAQAQPSQ